MGRPINKEVHITDDWGYTIDCKSIGRIHSNQNTAIILLKLQLVDEHIAMAIERIDKITERLDNIEERIRCQTKQ